MLFSDLIHPINQDDFFREYASRQPVLIKGPLNKFQSLFDWNSLNRILSQHRVEPPRCRVEKVGATPSELTIIDYIASPRGFLVPKVNPDLLYKRLNEGATLVLDAVNEADERIDLLSIEVGAIFSSRSQTNMYVSFGETAGFGVHWDSRDVFAVQVSGRKRWTVYYPTRESPLYRDFHDRSAKPSKIWWEGTLEQGSVLYVPRGWWHNVEGIGEPSMHLTVGADPLTGIEYLAWFTDQLRQNALWRQELPRFDGDLDQHTKSLHESISSMLSNNGLHEFLQNKAESRSLRPKYALPYGIESCKWLITNDKIINKVAHFFSYYAKSDRVVLKANGKEIELALEAEPLLRLLANGTGLKLSEINNAIPELSSEEILLVITALIQANILYIS